MLHETFRALADGTDGASSTLLISIVSGMVTVLVALIGVWGTRVKRDSTPAQPPVQPATDLDVCEAEIERLTRICYEWDIDPLNGHPMRHRRGRHSVPEEEQGVR